MRHTWLIAALLLTAGLAGCVGSEDGDGSDPDLESSATVSQDTGGIQGVVTNPAIEPIEGATVTLVELEETTTTASDGSYAFSNVEPGSYTLHFELEGFIGAEKPVDVQPDEVSIVDVILGVQQSQTPFTQELEFAGFLECSVAIGDDIAPLIGIGAVAVCAIPNLLLGGNATNDRFMFTHEIEENPYQMVTELTWDPGNPTAGEMSLVVEALGFPNNNSATFSERSGPGPIVLSADRATIEGLVNNLTASCANGTDSACNRNYIENGGPIQIRTFVDAGDLQPGLAVQQEYTLYNTIFYNAPACPDYSIVEDNLCEQKDAPPDA